MTLLLPQIEELEALMLQLPKLVDAVQSEDSQVLVNSREWLGRVERAFERNRLAPHVAAVAALRAELRMVELGVTLPNVTLTGQPRARRIREAGLLDVLRRAEHTLVTSLASTLTDHEEAEKLIRQLLAIARHKGVPDSAAPGPGDEAGLRRVWQAMRADADMATGAVRVLGLVGEADALALLDRLLGTA